jgi:hypothetical protein
MDSWDKDRIWEMVREYPEYRDGRLTEEQAAEIVEELHANKEEIFASFLEAEIRRTLMKMVARGEAEYDPKTDSYRAIPRQG